MIRAGAVCCRTDGWLRGLEFWTEANIGALMKPQFIVLYGAYELLLWSCIALGVALPCW